MDPPCQQLDLIPDAPPPPQTRPRLLFVQIERALTLREDSAVREPHALGEAAPFVVRVAASRDAAAAAPPCRVEQPDEQPDGGHADERDDPHVHVERLQENPPATLVVRGVFEDLQWKGGAATCGRARTEVRGPGPPVEIEVNSKL